jgi:hypothetical protein
MLRLMVLVAHTMAPVCVCVCVCVWQATGVWACGNSPTHHQVSFLPVAASVVLSESCSFLQHLHAARAQQQHHAERESTALFDGLVSIILSVLSTLAVLAGAVYSRQWCTSSSRGGATRRAWAVRLMVCVGLVWSMCATGWYYNGSFVSEDGERITGRAALGDLGAFLDRALACMSDPSPDYCRDWGLVRDMDGWHGHVSPYTILEVPEDAPLDQCKAQHKKLALTLHPDKCTGCTPEQREERNDRFVKVQQAWDFLKQRDAKEAKSNHRDHSSHSQTAHDL